MDDVGREKRVAPRTYSFDERLQFSKGRRQQVDIETIRAMIPGCIRVVKTNAAQDRRGVDYIATLQGGREIGIDAKSRDAGASRFWRHGPELALEVWSVLDPVTRKGVKMGWTCSDTTEAEMILFTFAPRDTQAAYLVGFQSLRMAFMYNGRKWLRQYGRNGKAREQYTPGRGGRSGYISSCVFVPADVVLRAMMECSQGNVILLAA